MKITDENGTNLLVEKPTEGQMCQIKIKGSKGYNGCVKFTNGYFESIEEESNRTVITRWKADYWLPAE